MRQGGVIFAEEYSYRDWGPVLFAALIGLFGAIAMTQALLGAAPMAAGVDPVDGVAMVLMIAMSTFGGLFVWFAWRMFRAYRRGTTIGIEINDGGVVVGEREYPWAMVLWIGGRKSFPWSRSSFNLCLGAEGNVNYDIPLNRRLGREEFLGLMKRIEERTRAEYPELEVGRVVSSTIKLVSPPLPG
jgi:hypothetical protein